MKRVIKYTLLLATLVLTVACMDDEVFSSSRNDLLTFSTDTVKLDTCFSTVPTPTKTFWVYNKSGKGIRCSQIRLKNGNQTGFRVNVDGVYLGPTQGYLVNDQEIRNKDSIRVFVELTSPINNSSEPQEVSDDLVFLLESGAQQQVKLNAYSWDADLLRNITVTKDTIIGGKRPTVIYGNLTVNEGATLNIEAGKTLYMHGDAQIDVYGTLSCIGTPNDEITIRGDRLDRMFDYLPYDGISGQWKGIRFHEPSYGNIIRNTNIHSASDAIVCDSSDVNKDKLKIENSTIHNNQGYGVLSTNSFITIENSQLSNCLKDIVAIYGGNVEINGCTLAQFYPFDGNRGSALSFTNYEGEHEYPLNYFAVRNTICTGYADDVIMGNAKDSILAYSYFFDHCLLRTPEIEDTINCVNVIWEDVKDTICSGVKNFKKIDTELLQYDFHLAEKSLAIGKANPKTSLPSDRNATKRDDMPDIGCYEAENKDVSNENK